MMNKRTNATAVPGDCVSPRRTAGTALAIDPKMGMSENTVDTIASTGQYLRPDQPKARPRSSVPLMLGK